jgi:hypothetical protein
MKELFSLYTPLVVIDMPRDSLFSASVGAAMRVLTGQGWLFKTRSTSACGVASFYEPASIVPKNMQKSLRRPDANKNPFAPPPCF